MSTINGYPVPISVLPGKNAISFCVAADATQVLASSWVDILVFRQGAAEMFLMGDLMQADPADPAGYTYRFQIDPSASTDPDNPAPNDQGIVPPAYDDWGWHSYGPFDIPATWPTGAYIAIFVPDGMSPPALTADGPEAKALFIVRPQAGHVRNVLFKVPTNTFYAYDGSGGLSLYFVNPYFAGINADPDGSDKQYFANWLANPYSASMPHATDAYTNFQDGPGLPASFGGHAGEAASLRRPGGGTGCSVYGPDDPTIPDAYDQTSLRNSFAHWVAKFIRWLESTPFAKEVDYCSDADVESPGALTPYNAILCVGHDEYWTPGMYQNVSAFVAAGGNIMAFSGDTCHYVTYYVNNGATMVSNKPYAPAASCWSTQPQTDTMLFGVTYGGFLDTGRRDPSGFTLQNTEHWALRGIKGSGPLGVDSALVGYEASGALVRGVTGAWVVEGTDGCPLNFLVLGSCDIQAWKSLEKNTALMGTYTAPSGGIVFTASTIDWPRFLVDNGAEGEPAVADPDVRTITANVFRRLSVRSIRIDVGVDGMDSGPVDPSVDQSGGLEVGSSATFSVDTAGLAKSPSAKMYGGSAFPVEYLWEVSVGNSAVRAGNLLTNSVTLAITSQYPITVAVTVALRGQAHFFGSLTLWPRLPPP